MYKKIDRANVTKESTTNVHRLPQDSTKSFHKSPSAFFECNFQITPPRDTIKRGRSVTGDTSAVYLVSPYRIAIIRKSMKHKQESRKFTTATDSREVINFKYLTAVPSRR